MYAFFKSVHILGFVLMAGNVTVTALWKVFADRTSNTRIIAFAQWLVTVTDYSFTFFGGFLMVVGGYGAAWVGNISLIHTPWLVLGQLMLLLAGAIWAGILIPIQIRQAGCAQDFAVYGEVSAAYRKDSRVWLIWGLTSTVPLIAGLWFMVAKPMTYW